MFMPAFFTMFEMVVPTIVELICNLIFGVAIYICLIFMVRGIQLE